MLSAFTVGYHIILTRIFSGALGTIAVIWGLYTVQSFWRQAPMEHIAQHIILGERYDVELLRHLMATIEEAENSANCRPIALWSAAVIRLRMVEEAIRNEQEAPIVAHRMTMLDNSIRRSLSCSAGEPFLWLVLFWSAARQNRIGREASNYLRMSYELGPNEGWIALKRNSIAFANYKSLPTPLQADAIRELLALINSEFYQQAVDIFSGPAWQLRDTILPRLAQLPDRRREAFARALYDRGLHVEMPEIGLPGSTH